MNGVGELHSTTLEVTMDSLFSGVQLHFTIDRFFENIFLLFLNLTTVNSGQPFCETDEARLDAHYHQDDR